MPGLKTINLSWIDKLTSRKKHSVVFAFYLLFGGILFLGNYQSGLTTDFNGLILKLSTGNWSGIWTSFGFPALQPFLNFIYFSFYKLFGIWPFAWQCLFLLLHCLNAYLLFLFSKQLFLIFDWEKKDWASFWIGALFLCWPYQSEVLTWKVCLNYLLSTAGILTGLYCFLLYISSQKALWRYIIIGLQVLLLLTFELSLAFPFLILILFLALQLSGNSKKGATAIFLPLLGLLISLLALYFIGTKWVVGEWVGHYGASVHLRIDFTYTFGNFYKYFFKYLFLGRYLPYDFKTFLFQDLYQLKYFIPIFTLTILFIAFLLFRYKRLGKKSQLLLLSLGLFSISLLPIITLYFNFLMYIENDRYGYLASAFFAMTFVIGIHRLPRLLYYLILIGYLCTAIYLLNWTNTAWRQSQEVFWALMEDFDTQGAEHIFLINLPDNMRGAVMFRDYSGQDQAFASSLKYVGNRDIEAKIHEILQYNITSVNDGVEVEKIGIDRFKITFLQEGNWWWRRGQGATNKDLDWYRIEVQGTSYILTLKALPENSILLYQLGKEWKKIE